MSIAEAVGGATFGATHRIRVLVVDEALIAHALGSALVQQPDIEVIGIAPDGDDALSIVADEQPDVVLTAFDLAGGNALDLVRRVREQHASTRVVVVTSTGDPALLAAAVAAGCAGFLTRRQTPDDVIRAVRSAHAGDLPIDPDVVRQLVTKGRPAERHPGPDLTERESAVLTLLARGLMHAEIAASLNISVNTVRNHAQRVLEKLGAHSRFEAVLIARRRGLAV